MAARCSSTIRSALSTRSSRFPLYAYLGGGKEGVRVMRRHILRPAVTALGTCSSVATIPTNLEAAEDSGVPRDISDLVLPLGATMHMDGSCFSCVLKIAFLFGVFGIPFEGAGLIVKILLVAVFSSVAMSGIPGGGYIGEYIICTLFFPAQMAIAYPIAVTIGQPSRPACHNDQRRGRLCCYISRRALHRGKRLA